MNRLQRQVVKRTTNALLRVSAALARRPALHRMADAWHQGLAASMARSRGIQPASSLEALGTAWQRGFGSPKQIPITQVTDDTVYAEIHTVCPLRGSGDLRACHRMMEYDRALLKHAGGQFVVLDSAAAPGRHKCTVAMRLAGADLSDLTPAYTPIS